MEPVIAPVPIGMPWNLEIRYSFGANELIILKEDGTVDPPLRSDNRLLVRLVGFKNGGAQVRFATAAAGANVAGFAPMFETTDGAPTTLLAQVTRFGRSTG